MSRPRQICTFLLSEHLFGLDVDCVLEVIRSQPVTQVPLAPESISGLMNLRGQIVTAIDLRLRLGLPEQATAGPQKMSIIVRTIEGPLCFSIDDVGDVLEIAPTDLEALPENMMGTARKMIEGVAKLPSQLLLILRSDFNSLAGL